ncbi:MAG TPA: NADH:flavin oxidoreductase, partial [Kiloniellaceae bacterium]|nr:NADH:flavin oxidoreductase [Kiloniellaceae bacterium]
MAFSVFLHLEATELNQRDPLLQPFQLKGLTLRNRIMSTSHAPSYVVDGNPGERYRLYHREKARGGLALTMFGGSSNVAPDSPSVFGQIDAGRDEVIPYFQALADAVHGEGAAVMCQLTHMGRRTVWNQGDWLPVIAPSRVREPAHRAFPKEMDAYDIARVVTAYGAAARRCKEGGLDGLELLAHGHLLEQFWSPRTNLRSDAYGGSRENRLRFTFEVLEAVRRQVGPDFIVGIRVGSESTMEGDLDLAENLAIAGLLERSGLIDFFNVNRGHIESDRGLAHMIPGMADPLAPHLAVVAAFKREVKLPVFHACRVNDLSTARHAVEAGLVDMVGMTRAHIADPHIARKLMAGEEARIRPCVGAAYCIDRIYEGGEALCLHNAATGREGTMPHLIPEADDPKKTVVVVGGGPAGLEAARVSAERGHRVVLFEAARDLGGQMTLAAKASWRRDLGGVVSWYADELLHLGVTVKTNHFADDADVLAEDPDVVIVASGGLPDPLVTEGEELVTST